MGSDRPRDVVVVGGGPGGYVAAIRAAQLGARVTLIEKEHLGGTCLNVGCIPTKALLHAGLLARSAREGEACGVRLKLEGIDWAGVRAFQSATVEKLVGGVAALLKTNGVEVITGTARFLKPRTLEIEGPDGARRVQECDRIILAVGSVPAVPPIPGLAGSRAVVDSTGALSLEALPASLAVIGGGVIGLEMACAFRALGSEVTVVEALDRLAPAMDGEMTGLLARSLEKQGIRLLLGHKVEQVEDADGGACLRLAAPDGQSVRVRAEKILCAVGRRPNTEALDCQAGGVACEKGRIRVDEHLQTSVPGVWAIGDCVGQVMLAHAASAMGEVAAENAAGGDALWRPASIPAGVYTFPELAGVGETEEQLRARGAEYYVGRFPLSANGRALIENGGEGMVKVLVGKELDEVLGIHLLAPHATELIAEGAAALQLESTVFELMDAIHPHPTLSEAVREAALAARGRAIHTINRKKR